MKNIDYIICCLKDEIDDGGASFEACVHYNIACPYSTGDTRAHCYDKDIFYPNRKHCTACKMEWLDSEVDD